jgi:hypothetical protein
MTASAPIPTPPDTIKAPLSVLVELTGSVTRASSVNSLAELIVLSTPRLPAITTVPVLLSSLSSVSVTIILETSRVCVIVVLPATLRFPPMPTPPATTNAPVVVEVLISVLKNLTNSPTCKFLPIPAPPATVNAPVSVLSD